MRSASVCIRRSTGSVSRIEQMLMTMPKTVVTIAEFQTAERILRTLASPEYLAEPRTNGGFLLKHSVGHLPNKSEVDVPLTYADYYFLEALTLYPSEQ